jgi:hypothetical protein
LVCFSSAEVHHIAVVHTSINTKEATPTMVEMDKLEELAKTVRKISLTRFFGLT